MSQVYLTPWSLLTCFLSSKKVLQTKGQNMHSTPSFGMLDDPLRLEGVLEGDTPDSKSLLLTEASMEAHSSG